MKKQAGLTMVEMMVAITISLILLAGISQIYLSNKQTYRVTNEMSRLQENGRFAMSFITQSIYSADHWGCLGHVDNVSDPGNIISADIDNDGSNEGVINFSTGLSAIDNVAVAGIPEASDTIRLISASQDAMSVNGITVAGANSFAVDNASEFSVGDNIMINDCKNAQISAITGIAGNTVTISDNLLRAYIDSTVHKLLSTTYTLGVNAAGNPALYMDDTMDGSNTIELVEGVENMQIIFGEDTDADLVPDYFVASGTAGLDMNNVVSIRLVLTVRTLENNIALNARDIDGDGTDDDKRIAKDYTAMIALRNRLN